MVVILTIVVIVNDRFPTEVNNIEHKGRKGI